MRNKIKLLGQLIYTLLFLLNFQSLSASQINANGSLYSEWMDNQKNSGFEENLGQFECFDKQAASFVLFKMENRGMNIWVTTSGLTYQFYKFESIEESAGAPKVIRSRKSADNEAIHKNLEWSRVDMNLTGASIKKENVIMEGDISSGQKNYYHAHSPEGVTNVRTYRRLIIQNIYPGIDWVLYTQNGTVEHEYVVHPKADPKLIQMTYEGNGNFIMNDNFISFSNSLGNLTEGQLLSFQGPDKKIVESDYDLNSKTIMTYAGAGNTNRTNQQDVSTGMNLFSKRVSIRLGTYDDNRDLIIDPRLVWGTYYGGSSPEQPRSITTDKNGNMFIGGISFDVGFPTQAWGGAYYLSTYAGGLADCFLMCFTNNGQLNWATYYGGQESEWPNALLCDKNDHLFVTGLLGMDVGITISTFPTLNLAGAYNQPNPYLNAMNAFMLRFNSTTGIRDWATIVAEGEPRSMALDNAGNLYVTGGGNVRPAQFRSGAYNDSTFAGGFDVLVLRFNPACQLTWATNYGGPNYEEGIDIATDENGNVYITGSTTDSFPIFNRPGAYNQSTYTGGMGDGHLLRFDNSGALTWATYYQGTQQCTNVLCDPAGNVYMLGYSDSLDDGPLQIKNRTGAFNQPVYGGGGYDCCIMQFDPAGALQWGTYFGGADQELIGNFSCGAEAVMDECGNLTMSLTTLSTNPTTIPSYTSCNQYSYSGVAMGAKVYMLKFTDTGDISWGTLFGGNGSAAGWGCMLALDKEQNLFATKAVYEPNLQWPLLDPGSGAFFDTTADLQEDLYIAKFNQILPTFIASQVDDSSCSCGSATVTLTCGEPNYDYVWSNGSQTLGTDSTSSTISGLTPGIYAVTISSACHVIATASFTIHGVAAGIDESSINTALQIFPNPSNGYFTVIDKTGSEVFNMEMHDVAGQLVYSQKLSGKMQYEIHPEIPGGLYFVQLKTDKYDVVKKLVIQ